MKVPARGTAGFLRTVLGTPNALVELREPVMAQGPHGRRRSVSRVALFVDDLPRFRSALGRSAS